MDQKLNQQQMLQIMQPILTKIGSPKSQCSDINFMKKKGWYNIYLAIKDYTSFITGEYPLPALVYIIVNDIREDLLCPACGSPQKWMKENRKFTKFCSRKCANQNQDQSNNPFKNPQKQKEIAQKKREKYTSEQIADIHREAMLKKYGVSNASQLDFVKKKKRDKQLKPGVMEQMVKRQQATMMKRYGVRNFLHDPDNIQKQMEKRYKAITHRFKTGEEIKVFGYESYAFDILEEEYNLGFNDFQTSKRKCIRYIDHDGKDRRYLPDIVIPKHNKIIEVKSDYTITRERDVNARKWDATIANEWLLEIWIIKNNGEIREKIEWTSTLSEYYINHYSHQWLRDLNR